MTDLLPTTASTGLREQLACLSALPAYVLLPPYEWVGSHAPVAVVLTHDKAALVASLGARPVLGARAGVSHAYTLPATTLPPVWLVQSDEGLVPESWAKELLAQRQSSPGALGGVVWEVSSTSAADLAVYWRGVHTLSVPQSVPAEAWQRVAQRLASLSAVCVPSADASVPFNTQVAQLLNTMAHGFGSSPVSALKPLLASGPAGDARAPLQGHVLLVTANPTGVLAKAQQWQSELCKVALVDSLGQASAGEAAAAHDLEILPAWYWQTELAANFDVVVVHDLVGWSLQHVQGKALQEALESWLRGAQPLAALMQAGLDLLLTALKTGGRLVVDQPAVAEAESRHWEFLDLQHALQAQACAPVQAWAAWPDTRTWIQWPCLSDGSRVSGLLNVGLAQLEPGTQGVLKWPTELAQGHGLARAQAWCCVLEKTGQAKAWHTFPVSSGQALAYQWQGESAQAFGASDSLWQPGAQTAQQGFFLCASRDGWTYAALAQLLERYLQAVQTIVPQWPLQEWLAQVHDDQPLPAEVGVALAHAMPDQIGWDGQGKVFARTPHVGRDAVASAFTASTWLLSVLQVFLKGTPQWGLHAHKRRYTRQQWAENLLSQAGIQCLAADWDRAGIRAQDWGADEFLPTPEQAPELIERDAQILALEQQLHYLQTDQNIMAEKLANATAIAKGVTADVRRVVTQEVTADVSLRVSEAVSREVSAAYEASLSWRVTRPLRKAKEWLTRIRTGAPAAAVKIQPELPPVVGGSPSPTVQAVPHASGHAGQPDAWLEAFLAAHTFAPAMPSTAYDADDLPRYDYGRWVGDFDQPDVFARQALARHWAEKQGLPVLGLLCLPAHTPQQLRAIIGDLLAQPYAHWRLVVMVLPELLQDDTCRQLLKADERLLAVPLEVQANWAECLGAGLQAMPPEVQLMSLWRPDSRLACAALGSLALAWHEHPEWALVYGDADLLNEQGQRCHPHFKPDWNEALFFSSCLAPQPQHSLISGALWASPARWRALVVPEVPSQEEGVALTALALVLQTMPLEEAQWGHVPMVMTHLAQAPLSKASRAQGLVLLETYFGSLGQAVGLQLTEQGLRLQWPLPAAPALVSLIIPTRNNPHLLGQCVRSILDKTQDVAMEIIVVDNGSDTPQALATLRELAQLAGVRVVRDSSPFNYSALNNHAVGLAKGQWVALVNDDIEVRDGQGQWLAEMLRLAARPQVGVVGAKLLYPHGTVQHAGVFLVGTLSWHAYRHFPAEHPGHCGQALLTRNSTCLTAACIVVRKSIYEQVGGLDAEQLTIGWNDTDFCLKVLAAGYQNVWTPDACLVHHESATRGQDQTPEKKVRAEREWRTMQKRWGSQMSCDPAYNPNLSCGYEDYSWAWPPRGPHGPREPKV